MDVMLPVLATFAATSEQRQLQLGGGRQATAVLEALDRLDDALDAAVMERVAKCGGGEAGSAASDGTCTADEIHNVCLKALPADFCTKSGQDDWCSEHVGEPWCVCTGRYGAYLKSGGAEADVDCAATSSSVPACSSLERDHREAKLERAWASSDLDEDEE